MPFSAGSNKNWTGDWDETWIDKPGEAPPVVPSGLIESVEEFTIYMDNLSTSATATISSVDTTRSAVFNSYGWQSALTTTNTSNDAPDHLCVRFELTSATEVTVYRHATVSTHDFTVLATVVQFVDGKLDSLQKGTVTITDTNTSNTASITSVDTSRSVVLWNGSTCDRTGSNRMTSGSAELALTDATTVTATRISTVDEMVAGFVVLEFASGVTDSIQEVSITVNNPDLSDTATITSVDTSRSMIFPGGEASFEANWILAVVGTEMELTNATTVTATRQNSAWVTSKTGTVVEFAADETNSIQRGSISLATTDTSKDATITSVDTTKAFVHSLGSQGPRTSALIQERQCLDISLINATTIRVTRGAGSASGDEITAGYEVIEGGA